MSAARNASRVPCVLLWGAFRVQLPRTARKRLCSSPTSPRIAGSWKRQRPSRPSCSACRGRCVCRCTCSVLLFVWTHGPSQPTLARVEGGAGAVEGDPQPTNWNPVVQCPGLPHGHQHTGTDHAVAGDTTTRLLSEPERACDAPVRDPNSRQALRPSLHSPSTHTRTQTSCSTN